MGKRKHNETVEIRQRKGKQAGKSDERGVD